MSLSNTNTEQTYQGNGSITTFPITFAFFVNSQVKVKSLDTSVDPAVETELTQGTEYNVVGTDVVFGVAPAASLEITVYRQTPRTQEVDYIETGAFKAEDHEKGMDRMVMMIQEIGAKVEEAIPTVGGGAFARLTAQTVLAAGTVTIATNQRMLKSVKGGVGGTTADTTLPIDNGTIDGQELRLVGGDDDDTLTIENSGNVHLNGDITFTENTVLDIFWDDVNTKWVETGRRQ